MNALQRELRRVFPNKQLNLKTLPTSRKRYVRVTHRIDKYGKEKSCRPGLAEVSHFVGMDKLVTVNGDLFAVKPRIGKMEHHKEMVSFQYETVMGVLGEEDDQ